jgi:methyl-accepting chemotaxis protein
VVARHCGREGDLTKRLEFTTQDEIGEAAKWFNTFMDKLQMVITNVATNTKGVAASSQRMSVVSQKIDQQRGRNVHAGRASDERGATRSIRICIRWRRARRK